MKKNQKEHFPHIGIFIGSEFHARSFAESGTLQGLLKNFKITLLTLPEIITNFPELGEANEVVHFIPDVTTKKLFAKQLRLGTLKFRKRSSSFRFRLSRNILGDYRPQKKVMHLLFWVGKIFIRTIKLLFDLINTADYRYNRVKNSYHSSVLNSIPVNKMKNLDLVIGWCQTSEPSAIAAIVYSHVNKIPSILVVDNWDNLSSKSIFGIEPTRVLCFGEQSVKFAEEIQKFKKGISFGIGSARFEIYRNFKPQKKENEETVRILFAGSSIALEDDKILTHLSEFLMKTKEVNVKKFEVTYKRHPAPQGNPTDLSLINLKYPLIKIHPSANSKSSWEKLSEVRDSLRAVDLVISMPTTLLLEARVCNLPVLVIAFTDNRIRTSSAKMMLNLEHLRGVSSIDGVKIVRNLSDLEEALIDFNSLQYSFEEASGLDYFVSWDNTTFTEKLTKHVRDLLC